METPPLSKLFDERATAQWNPNCNPEYYGDVIQDKVVILAAKCDNRENSGHSALRTLMKHESRVQMSIRVSHSYCNKWPSQTRLKASCMIDTRLHSISLFKKHIWWQQKLLFSMFLIKIIYKNVCSSIFLRVELRNFLLPLFPPPFFYYCLQNKIYF